MKKIIMFIIISGLIGCEKNNKDDNGNDGNDSNNVIVNSIAEISWPKSGGDLRNTNRSMEIRPMDVYPGPQLGQIAWQVNMGPVWTSPVVLNGFVYAAALRGSKFVCYTTNGDSVWEVRKNFEGDMTIGPSGQIYIGDGDSLLAYSSSGERSWGFRDRSVSDRFMYPVVGHDGTIYSSSGHDLVAFNPNGTKKWRYPAPCNMMHTGIIPTATRIYFNATDGIYTLNLDGTLITKFNYSPRSRIVMDANGAFFFHSSEDGKKALNCVGKNGQLKWQVVYTEIDTISPQLDLSESPAIDKDGRIYTAWEYWLHAFDNEGHLIWKFRLQRPVGLSSPVIDSEGNIYICTYHDPLLTGDPSYVYKINRNGEEVWHLTIPGYDFDVTPAIGPDGTMYVGTNNDIYGSLIAIH